MNFFHNFLFKTLLTLLLIISHINYMNILLREYFYKTIQILDFVKFISKLQYSKAGMTSYRGQTWGKVEVTQTALKLCTMDDHPKSVFSVDFQSINNATVNKNDIIIQTGAKIQDQQDCMCQIRFYVDIPKEDNDAQNNSDKSDQEKSQKEGEDGKPEKVIFTDNLYKKIIQKAKIGTFAGQSIVTLNQVNLAVPRGKYTIDFYQKNLRFHGQTYNFTIDYKNIMKGFLLPMENQSQVSIILQLHKDKPIYQGQTLYRNIVVQIKKDIEVEVKTRIKDKQKNQNLLQLKQQYSGPLFQVLMDLIKTTAQVTLIAPDSKDFKSKNGQSCVKCGVKAQPGWLYFLKRSLIFIPKPVFYFKIEDIRKVQFNRLGANNKQFDMKITLIEQKRAVQFMGIERNQLQILIEYFKTKNVKVQMQQDVKKIKAQIPGGQDDDQQDDGDFEAEGISEDDDSQSFEQQSMSQNNKEKKVKKQKNKQKQKQKKDDKNSSEKKSE